jgi:hypothetical protein
MTERMNTMANRPRLTKNDLAEMLKNNPAQLIKLSEQACLAHARRAVFEQTDKLVADSLQELTLDDLEPAVSETPITIPVGKLKGRPDLGNVGVHIKVTMELRNCDDMYAPKED